MAVKEQRRRSRRRGRRLAPVAVAIAFLLWLGSRGGGDEPGEVESRRPAQPDSDTGTTVPVRESRTDPTPEAGGESPLDGAEVERSATEAAVADRLWGSLRRMEDAGDEFDFVAGFSALADAETLALAPHQARRLEQARQRLDERLTQCLRTEIDGAARDGRVLESARRLAHFIEAGGTLSHRVAEVLQSECGWSDWDVPGPAPTGSTDVPLPRGIRVRFERDGRWLDGVVRVAQGDEVTLRVRTSAGDRFPTLPRVAVEPITFDDSALALAQAAAARRAGLPILAAAWCARADGPR